MFEHIVPEALAEINENREELIKRALLLHTGQKSTKKLRESLTYSFEGEWQHYEWEGNRILSISNIHAEILMEGRKYTDILIWKEYMEYPVEHKQPELF